MLLEIGIKIISQSSSSSIFERNKRQRTSLRSD